MPITSRRRVARFLLATLTSAALTGALPVAAADLHVDAAVGDDGRDGRSWAESLRTLQRALDVTLVTPEPADTIHVAEGTYPALTLSLPDITLLGGYPSGGGARDPVAHPTVLDGAGAGPALKVSRAGGTEVLRGVTVDGFRLTNGSEFLRSTTLFGGGGAFIEEAEVILTNNVITGNVVSGDGVLGGGVYVFRDLAGACSITDNRIEGNRIDGGMGGGFALIDAGDPATQGAILFARNDVLDNRASVAAGSVTPGRGQGGGLYMWGGAARVEGNTITGNIAESQASPDYTGQGGGIFVVDAAPTLTGNVITSNLARCAAGSYGAAGGGVYVVSTAMDTSGGTLRFSDNTVRANRSEGATGSAQASGAGLLLALFGSGAPVISNNVFTGNVGIGGGPYSSRGAGLYAYLGASGSSTLTVQGGTFDGNQAEEAGGGLYLVSTAPGRLTVDGVHVLANESDFASGIMAFGTIEVRNSRIRRNRVYDPDGDEVSELRDNCPGLANPVQSDPDMDLQGDACDTDDDGDGVLDANDNCPLVSNPGQGPACTGDQDGDSVADLADNCPTVANTDQSDATADGVGDVCEPAAFDGLETNASGIWVVGDSTLTNLEITENVGQGLQIVGLPSAPSAPAITNVTIAENAAAGFVTYLASGTVFRDSIIARNFLSDGFDTETMAGVPSSPGMLCDGVYFWDGLASLPCTGGGNLDFLDGDAHFVPGPVGDYYLSQVAAGDARTFVAVDAGTRPAAASPVAGRTTRKDHMEDAGLVDLGFHPPVSTVPPGGDPLAASLRLSRAPGAVRVAASPAPPTVTTIRLYRGDLALLLSEYSHATPFSGLPGQPECALAAAAALDDAAALIDGMDWYYLAVPFDGGLEGTFGDDSLGTERPRPEDSPSDRVTSACP